MGAENPTGRATASRRFEDQSGVALILVLAFLVLVTALVIAFFSSVTTELSGAKSYASGVNVKLIADSATQTVIGAIRQATPDTMTATWASQPGMIRTYDNTGAPTGCYKLFSSGTMMVTGTYNPTSDLNSQWGSLPAMYTDLNAPVVSGTVAHYPIIDGHNLASTYAPSPFSTGSLQAQSYFSPGSLTGTNAQSGLKNPDVEGFWIITDSNSPQGNVTYGSSILLDSGTTGPNPVPMPVMWLYELQDGTIVAPTTVAGNNNQVTVAGASATNPIVGRIAFWTDDDSCKVNVNTASEGNYSDTPRMQGITDFGIAEYPESQNEYQRYPGHPAMTCLSSVLGSIYPVSHGLLASTGTYTAPNPATYPPYQPYVDMAPRLNVDTTGNQGSQAGTVHSGTGTSQLTVKNDRLYASVDEFLFQPALSSTNTRLLNPTTSGTSSLNSSLIEETQFFLTAHSRAPDVNLFNLPRIVTWPVNATNDSAHRTIFDQALAFCGTVGNSTYYFQRQRNDHPTNDLPQTGSSTGLGRNRELIQYLQNLTSQNIPGFGGNFGGASTPKYPTVTVNGTSVSERDQILTEIFDYIRCLNLIDKSSSTMTNPFAPVASAVNSYSPVYAGSNGSGGSSTLTTNAGSGQVVPIYDTVNHTKGFGRFPTISEVSLIFIATGWNDGNGGQNVSDPNYEGSSSNGGASGHGQILYTTGALTGSFAPWGFYSSATNAALGTPTSPAAPDFVTIQPAGTPMPAIPASNIQVQAQLLINFFDPSQGNVWNYGTYSVQVSGLGNFTWGTPTSGTSSMGFPSSAPSDTSYMVNTATVPQYAVRWGGNMGFRTFFATEQAGQATSSAFYYPFFSGVTNLPYNPATPAAPGNFYFSGGTITINMLLPTTTGTWSATLPSGWPLTNTETPTRPPIQQIQVSFPSGTFPIPLYAPSAVNAAGSGSRQDRGDFNIRTENTSSNFAANAEYISGSSSTSPYTDVVRSLRAYPGDIRMIAGKVSVTDTQASPAPSPGYFDSSESKISSSGVTGWTYSGTTALVHSLRESVDYPFPGALLGQLVPGVSYSAQPSPTTAPFPLTYGSNGLDTFCGAGNNATLAGAYIGGGTNGLLGDWDNGFGASADGPYINKPDEGDYNFAPVPYFSESNYNDATQNAGQTYFSPNRLMPSPGMFGSLPTGVARNIPWQTLLFCPNPAAIVSPPSGTYHPGFGVGTNIGANTNPPFKPPYTTPPDHLFLDLFNMPVVEPYPISEPLSTAGRINMNYQIAPFSYIERNTGLRAILKSERMTVVPNTASTAYKGGNSTVFNLNSNFDYRVPINPDETLKAFDNYFNTNNDIFRSASQICDMFLYPAKDAQVISTSGPTWDSANSNITTFWNTHQLTGDNSRERPYTTIYPRLTTKSNTFTVHMRVQTLKKLGGSNQATWTEGSDVVTGEYRGSQTIERYVDPSDPNLATVDFANSANTSSLNAFYKFRVINTKQFAP